MHNLSFIISTKNRLDFLQITLKKLINGLQPNEEIIVVDGESSDGTREYLEELLLAGQIHQYISEKDRNQAHGWNKAMLLARGTIIKKIIDDDVFDYKTIRKCAEFMLAHPSIDVIISNELNASLNNFEKIGKSSRLKQFIDWKNKKTDSFTFSDAHLLIRKSALSYIGLYNTHIMMMDWEYALRISSLKTNIVYYTGYNALSVGHQNTISSNKNTKLVHKQGEQIRIQYNYAGDNAEISFWSKIKVKFGKILFSDKIGSKTVSKQYEISAIYERFYHNIDSINKELKGEFILS